ncbi:MAG: VWA domain-containing protein [Bryobacteraceae bacterium]
MRAENFNPFLRTLMLSTLVAGTAAVAAFSWIAYAQEPAPPATGAEGEDRPTFRVKVDMVVLSFTVTDNKGRYVNGLKPSDFRILEDGITQKVNTFSEGNKPPVLVMDDGSTRPLALGATAAAGGAGEPGDKPAPKTDSFVGTNVFVLFDTSNYMYRGFVYASDAIADFIRGLDRADSVAVYTFSRNMSRAAELTSDRNNAIFGLRRAVAGDDAALYNALLLALRDAAKVPGRKVVIVFSNGPDNASMVAPDDVRAVAEDEGIPIYVISTSDVSRDPISTNVFKRISQRTGGQVYFAKTWQKQVEAFESIRESLGNSYTVTYYPQQNPNEGFRKISVEIASDAGKKLRVRARPGYRPSRTF